VSAIGAARATEALIWADVVTIPWGHVEYRSTVSVSPAVRLTSPLQQLLEELTSRPGTASKRVRTVAATVSSSSGVIPPSIVVERRRSWASTAQTSHAELAKK
jgi:hypothetical protein